MRLFIAVEISSEIQNLIDQFISDAKKFPQFQKGTKWGKSGNFHLTLKFMGEIEENKVETLKEALSRSVKGQEKFCLEFKGIGAFPNLDRPRVLWIGVEENISQLMKLANLVEKETVESGFSKSDKPFSAHLTLARFSFPPQPSYLESLKPVQNISFGKLYVDRISLIQSILQPAGAEHQPLDEFIFTEN